MRVASPVPALSLAAVLLCTHSLHAGGPAPSGPGFGAAGYRGAPPSPPPPPHPGPRNYPRGGGFPGYAPVAVTYPQPAPEAPTQPASYVGIPYPVPVFAPVERPASSRPTDFYAIRRLSGIPATPKIIELGEQPRRRSPLAMVESDPVVSGERPRWGRSHHSVHVIVLY